MKCPKCQYDETKVLESRLSADGGSIRRRRTCRQCNYRFTTYEKIEELVFQIKKRNGHIQPYHRDKALRSIQIACQKRPIKLEQMEFALSQVERRIQEKGEKFVPSEEFGNLLMEVLQELDPIAYIRFASVYKDFDDPKEFMNILRSIEEHDLNPTAAKPVTRRPMEPLL